MRRFAQIVSCLLACSGAMAAQGQAPPKRWYEKLDFSGDLRLRYEGFQKEGDFDDGRRDRLRYRLRVGVEAPVSDFLRLGVKVRSGDPSDPVSDNQSFEGGFSKHRFNLAEVYADFRVYPTFSVIGGKFAATDFWVTSDMQWDEDVVVEGAMERLNLSGNGGAFKKVEASFYQFVLDESGRGSDAWLLGLQARPTFGLAPGNELQLGAGYDSLREPQRVVDLTLEGSLTGNDVTHLLDRADRLVSDFRIVNVFAVWSNSASKRWPVQASLFWYKNLGAADRLGTEKSITRAEGLASDNDTAWFARIEVGGYREPRQLFFRYTRYLSEPDGVFYAYMQSDTLRSSNLDGHRFDVRVGAPARTYVNFTYYRTNPRFGEDTTANRWQLDYIMRF
jgi:hypothetical protein